MSQQDVNDYLDAEAEWRRRGRDDDDLEGVMDYAWWHMTAEERKGMRREIANRNRDEDEGRKCP